MYLSDYMRVEKTSTKSVTKELKIPENH